MCSRARRRRVSMSDRNPRPGWASLIYRLASLRVAPVLAVVSRLVSALACLPLMSAFSLSYSAFACFLHALAPSLLDSQRSLATSYLPSALTSSTLRAWRSEGSYFCSSSALATFSCDLASAWQMSFSLPFMLPHFAFAAFASASILSSSAFFALWSTLVSARGLSALVRAVSWRVCAWAVLARARATAAAMLNILICIAVPFGGSFKAFSAGQRRARPGKGRQRRRTGSWRFPPHRRRCR